jgi:hypothetical protein
MLNVRKTISLMVVNGRKMREASKFSDRRTVQ